MKPRILVICDFYLPGFKSGGGMWTVVNLVNRFYTKYDFFVLTRNYDGRDDKVPYTQVKTGEWNDVGNAKVFYVSDEMLRESTIIDVINSVSPQMIFLNAIFSTPSVLFSFSRWKGNFRDIPVVLAPCGNLSKESIDLKPLKKKLFLSLARLFRLHKGVIWKATSSLEETEIEDAVGKGIDIRIAPDLPPAGILPDFSVEQKPCKTVGEVNLAFVSRVVKKKNLDFLLSALLNIDDQKIYLKIVGLHEESRYWEKCLRIIKQLPPNIKVEITGGISYSEALDHMLHSHFFVLPTLNENFGYVFLEAMAAGCPLIISDRTIWNDLREKRIGWNLTLDSHDSWVQVIRLCCEMSQEEYSDMSANARHYAINWLSDPDVEAATASLLQNVIDA